MHIIEPIDLKILRNLRNFACSAAADGESYEDDAFPCRRSVRDLTKMPNEQTLLAELCEDFPEEPSFDLCHPRAAADRSGKVSR